MAQAIKRGKAKGIAKVTNAIWESAVKEGNVTAMIFFLKARAGWTDKPQDETPREAETADKIRAALREIDDQDTGS